MYSVLEVKSSLSKELSKVCHFLLQTVADILSNVLDERNAPAFEATAQVTTENGILLM